MDYLFILWYLATLALVGWAAVSIVLLGERRGLAETVALSMLFGAGVVPAIMFFLAWAGVAPNRAVIACQGVLSVVLLVVLWRRGKLALPTLTRGGAGKMEVAACCACFIAVALALFVVSIHSLVAPVFDIDAYALWGLKAKAVYHEGLRGDGLFHRLPLSYSHLNYPLLVPFLAGGVFSAVGRLDDSIWKVVFPFVYTGGALFMFAALRWHLSRTAAALLTAVFATAPGVLKWAGAGTADFPLTVFHFMSVFYLLAYLEKRRRSDFVFCALATALAAFTKNEGLALGAVNVAVMGMFLFFPRPSRRSFAMAVLFAGVVAALVLPWLIWRAGIPNTHPENYTGGLIKLFSAGSWRRLPEILGLFLKGIFGLHRWGPLWILAIAAVVLNPTPMRQRYVAAGWFLLAAHFAVYILVFMISPWSPQFLADMSLDRILLHVVPVVLFIAAFHAAPALAGKGDCGRTGPGE